jgi:hypothetical protein
MTRVPTPGSDSGQWGQILNDFLAVEHNSDGSLKKAGLILGAQPTTEKASVNGYAPLDVNGKVPAANLPTSQTPVLNDATTNHCRQQGRYCSCQRG